MGPATLSSRSGRSWWPADPCGEVRSLDHSGLRGRGDRRPRSPLAALPPNDERWSRSSAFVRSRTVRCRVGDSTPVFRETKPRLGMQGPNFAIDAVLSYWYTKRPHRAAAPGGAPRRGQQGRVRDRWSAAHGAPTTQQPRRLRERARDSRFRERVGTMAIMPSHQAAACGCARRIEASESPRRSGSVALRLPGHQVS